MASEIVYVACKCPNGLFLDLMGPEETRIDNTVNGPVKAVHRTRLKREFVRGSAIERLLDRVDDKGRPIQHGGTAKVSGGYGITPVSREFWAAWLEQNADYFMVKAELIFAESTPERAAKRAKEQSEIMGGLEPLDPFDPNQRKKLKIEPEDRYAA